MSAYGTYFWEAHKTPPNMIKHPDRTTQDTYWNNWNSDGVAMLFHNSVCEPHGKYWKTLSDSSAVDQIKSNPQW